MSSLFLQFPQHQVQLCHMQESEKYLGHQGPTESRRDPGTWLSKVSRPNSHREMKRLHKEPIKHKKQDHGPSATFAPHSLPVYSVPGQERDRDERHTPGYDDPSECALQVRMEDRRR